MLTHHHFNTVVVGAGLGGLTAGATLAKLGKKVLVLEQHYIPGGCATNFKRKDVVMEVGLHEMNGLHDQDIKVEIFKLLEVDRFIDFVQVPELFHVISRDSNFTFPHGSSSAQEALTDKFPHERKGILAFFKLMNDVLDEVSRMPQERWKLMLIYPLVPLLFPNIFKSIKSTCGAWLDKHIKDEQVKLVLTTNILYYSDDPYNHSLLHFAVAQAGYIRGGGHYIKGGSQKLSDYLVRYIENRGGQVLTGKEVERILFENDRAAGVQYKDAFNNITEPVTIHADAVVVNAAIPLAAKMLPQPYRQTLEKRIEKLETACSLISIYLVFDADLRQFGVRHYSTFVQGEGVSSLKDIKANNQGDWDKKCFVFVDYGQIDSGLAPAGKSFGVICAANYLREWEGLDEVDYKIRKEVIANLFCKRLDRHYPGILRHIIYHEIGTSKTIERYTRNPQGTPYGYAQSPAQSGLARIPAKSPVKNMYFASAWSFPGGGFTGSITGGYSTALAMNKSVAWQNPDGRLLKDKRIVRLLQKQLIAENTVELTFEKPEGFEHTAGQYAVLRLNKPKYNELDLPFRSLSIVSHADESALRFAMRISKSSFKQSCAHMEPGDEATIFGPCGEFVLTPDLQNLVFVVCGIGITPVMPILKELEKQRFKGRVFVFYSSRTQPTRAYHSVLSGFKIENYVYRPVITASEKRIDMDLLKMQVKDLKTCHYYLVGTSSFLTSMHTLLSHEQVEHNRIKMDDFG
jgi:phytoene dehydrogenase-like protein/ferredoxin-NADP reductase